MLYTRLDFLSYEIRLLNIKEAPDDQSIHCTLERTTLIDPGNYYALSYRWGDLRNKKKIVVDDAVIEVRYNLEAALRQLRSRGYLRVWIDALCINQEDLEERGLQIRNMRQIYSQAKLVVSWLGDDPDNIASAVKYLLENGRYLHFPGRRRTAVGQGYSSSGGNTEEEKEWDDQRWRIFQSFCELDYWRRVWVIQEIASSTCVEVLFGCVAMSWDLITTAIYHWKDHSDKVPKACASYQYAAELNHFRICFTSTNRRPISLIEAIQWSHYALATDPRDKIYALLGLTSDGPRLVPMPNYKQTLEQVLEDLTRAMVDAEKSLDFISMKFWTPSKNEWPSQVANSLYFWSGLNMALGAPMCSWNPMFSQIPIQQVPNEKTLRAQGTILGQICEISSLTNHGAFVATSEMGAADMYCNTSVLPNDLHEPYPSGIATAILQSLSLGLAPTGIDFQYCLNNFWRPKARKEVFGGTERRSQWDNINLWLRRNASLRIGASTLQGWSQLHSKTNRLKYILHPSDVPYSDNDFEHCIEGIDKVLQSSMRLMVTQTGLIGMAPPSAQISDSVCYIKGCSIPVILRKKEMALHSTVQEHLVVGGAYLYVDKKFSGSLKFADWAETYFKDPTWLQTIVLS